MFEDTNKYIEHRNHINWNTTQHSVITEHRISHQHDFEWMKCQDIRRGKDT